MRASQTESLFLSLSHSIRPVSATTMYTYIVVIYRHDLRTRIFLVFKLISCYSFYGGAHVSHFVFEITVGGRFLGSPPYACIFCIFLITPENDLSEPPRNETRTLQHVRNDKYVFYSPPFSLWNSDLVKTVRVAHKTYVQSVLLGYINSTVMYKFFQKFISYSILINCSRKYRK